MKFWHEVDGLLLREAAKHADAIRDALIKTVPVDDIVNRWVDTRVAGETVTPVEARDWANNNFKLPERPLKDALDHIYATGWVMGDDVALAAYANARYNLKKAAPSGQQLSAAINTNWDNWKPGNRAAAALVRPPGGLKALLDKADATVADANKTTLNRIGTLLADSVGSGKGYDSLARALLRDDITSSVIKDASRAQMIAVTEISRALNTSTVDNYGQFGVEMVEWLAIDTGVCEICPANEAQGPIKLGDVFDSGDEAPPAHPNCRCTILPVVDEGAAANLPTEAEPDLSTPEMEISDVADHAIEDIAAAPAEPSVADLPKLSGIFPTEAGDDAKEALNGIYGGRDFNGFEVKPRVAYTFVDADGSQVIKFKGTIVTADGERAGILERTFTQLPDGTRVVQHDLMQVYEQYRGQGFSTAFSKFSEDYYRANGVSKIDIYAGLENGGYTWAKAGYEFTWQPDNVIKRFGDRVDDLRNSATRDVGKYLSEAEAEALADRLEAIQLRLATEYPGPDYIKPFDIANIEGPDLFGKSLGRWLLDGTNWVGAKKL